MLRVNAEKSESLVETGVVLCDPYATITSEYTGDGNALYTCEKIVVDVLYGNSKMVKKVPVDLLVRCNG